MANNFSNHQVNEQKSSGDSLADSNNLEPETKTKPVSQRKIAILIIGFLIIFVLAIFFILNQLKEPETFPPALVPAQKPEISSEKQLIWSDPRDILWTSVSPDGKVVLIGTRDLGSDDKNDKDDTYIVEVANQKKTHIAQDLIGGTWSSDGTQIAFNGPWVAQKNGQNLREIDQEGRQVSWSPDGLNLAYIKETGKSTSLIIADLISGETREILNIPGYINSGPIWSPNGKELLYRVGYIGGDWYSTDLKAEKQIELTDENIAHEATWSPDGKYIIYDTGMGGQGISVVNREGKDRRVVTPNGLGPKWSSDGQSIRYQVRSEISAQILLWEIGIDGQNKKQIGPKEGFIANYVIWSPKQNQVFISTKERPNYTIYVQSW